MHRKYYPKMLFSDFAGRIGLNGPPAGPNPFDQFDIVQPSESELGQPWTKYQKKEDPWSLAPLVCDASTLARLGNNVGIQADIVKAHWAAIASRDWPIPAALFVLGVSVLPWLWYFLLRRIAELRAAIVGNPPKP